MIINNEEKFVILKKLEVPVTGQIYHKMSEPNPQDGVMGR